MYEINSITYLSYIRSYFVDFWLVSRILDILYYRGLLFVLLKTAHPTTLLEGVWHWLCSEKYVWSENYGKLVN